MRQRSHSYPSLASSVRRRRFRYDPLAKRHLQKASKDKASDSPIPLEELNRDAAVEIYTPLTDGWIRLIELHQASFLGDPVECTLVTKRLEDAGCFQALSYVWGPIDEPQSIVLNGKQYKVTKTLYDALQHIRESDDIDNILIWVDALAINQCDISERNAQVRIMRDIYSAAAKTISWLGRGSTIPGYSELNDTDFLGGAFRYLPHLTHRGHEKEDIATIEDGLESLLMHLYLIVKLDYWKRVWTLQEITASHHVFLRYGTREWPLLSFIKLVKMVKHVILRREDHWDSFPSEWLHIYEFNTEILTTWPDGDTFFHQDWVYNILGQRECTNPRDRIFGFLSYFPASMASKLVVDYNMPEIEVWTMFAREVMKYTHNLDYLRQAECSTLHTKTPNLPSWVTDYSWRNCDERQPLETVSIGWTAFLLPTVDFGDNGETLRVKGYRFGCVCRNATHYYEPPREQAENQIWNWIKNWYETSHAYLEVTAKQLDSFIFAMVSGVDSNIEEYFPTLKAFLTDELSMPLRFAHPTKPELLYGELPNFTASYFRGRAWRRSLFTFTLDSALPLPEHTALDTTQWFGLGPDTMATGDEIYLLPGCESPVVLRKKGLSYVFMGCVAVAEETFGDLFLDLVPRLEKTQSVDLSIC